MDNHYWAQLLQMLSELHTMVPTARAESREDIVYDARDVADGGARLNDIGERLTAIGRDFSSVAEVAAYDRDQKRQSSETAPSTE